MQRRSTRLAELSAYQAAELAPISIGRSEREQLMHQTVSGNYFEALGVQELSVVENEVR
jgi:hypothetical protein